MKSYERPKVQTLTAGSIVEAMGPVSCGSGIRQTPGGLGEGSSPSSAGPLDFSR